MAEIVLGVGTSHSPLLTFDAELWNGYIQRDYTGRKLNLSDGRWVSYQELSKETGDKFADLATIDQFRTKSDACQRALDHLADDIAAAKLDAAVIITDDEDELFGAQIRPAVAIYCGEQILTTERPTPQGNPNWFQHMVKVYGTDAVHAYPALPDFAYRMIEQMIENGIDVGCAMKVEDPKKQGFGHGVGFVINRLFKGAAIPVVPVLLNTYFQPNAPKPARCLEIGRAIARSIRALPDDMRVGVFASGGLSHFTVDEVLDGAVLEAMKKGDSSPLGKIPAHALNSGSSEIRNWIALAAAVDGMKNRWLDYQPLYRTPAGTGIGVAFGIWE